MVISLADLPPKYQAQALVQLKKQKQGVASSQRKQSSIPAPSAAPAQGPKYRNCPTTRTTNSGSVIRFASAKEAKRYDTLVLRLKAGQIRDLKLQVDFTLQEAFTDPEGNRVRAIKYCADFTYFEKVPFSESRHLQNPDFDEVGWRFVVEDVKSSPTRTQKYLIKKKMMKERFGLEIFEV